MIRLGLPRWLVSSCWRDPACGQQSSSPAHAQPSSTALPSPCHSPLTSLLQLPPQTGRCVWSLWPGLTPGPREPGVQWTHEPGDPAGAGCRGLDPGRVGDQEEEFVSIQSDLGSRGAGPSTIRPALPEAQGRRRCGEGVCAGALWGARGWVGKVYGGGTTDLGGLDVGKGPGGPCAGWVACRPPHSSGTAGGMLAGGEWAQGQRGVSGTPGEQSPQAVDPQVGKSSPDRP